MPRNPQIGAKESLGDAPLARRPDPQRVHQREQPVEPRVRERGGGGQYSSVAFSANSRVVTTLGGSPFAEVRSITTSSRPRSTAYLYVAVNAPSSDGVRHRGARFHVIRSTQYPECLVAPRVAANKKEP